MASKELIHRVIDDPAEGRERLDDLFEMMDSGDPEAGLDAAWALSLVGSRFPDTVDDIAEGLASREGAESSLVLGYLEGEYPELLGEEVRPGTHYVSAGVEEGTGVAEAGGGVGAASREEEGTGEEEEAGVALGGLGGEDEGDLFEVDDGVYMISTHSRFDELEVVRHEGWGRYSDIYRAAAREDGEEFGVALRVVHHPEGAGREEFVRELDEALSLWSEVGGNGNIIEVYDWGTDPRPWVVTDIFEGDLERAGAVRPDVLAEDVLELADALSYAHDSGVVHYGIDPENVVYLEGDLGENMIPCLDNFGLMEVFKGHYPGSSILDPRYAAPEYFEGDFGSPGIHTDIYQFGAVIFRMATGRAPFEGSLGEVRSQVLNGEVPRVSGLSSGIPLGLDGVVRKAMSKQKLTRYESMDSMRGDLHRILGGGE